MIEHRIYAAIDLKSFYASVECVARGYDPLKTCLVVADAARSDKTICLAVTPAMKECGVKGRPRLFEVKQIVKEINRERKRRIAGRPFTGQSSKPEELAADPFLEMTYHVAVPRMAEYIKISTRVYEVYLRYVSPMDIHVYSIDEVFIDLTEYLSMYAMSPHDLVMHMIRDVLHTTGITATAGIGTNLFLAKAAMDIAAKHMQPDQDGVRIASLDEISYREKLWDHTPLTDFWRIGRGTAAKLEENAMHTMGEVAARSLEEEDLFFRLFGVNAELIIDHAWGRETCLMQDIKDYKPRSNSLGAGQVLMEPYTYEKGKLIVKEMAEQLALDLLHKHLVSDEVALAVGYDRTSKADLSDCGFDMYGRAVPRGVHGGIRLARMTSSAVLIKEGLVKVYESIVNPDYLVRRITISALNTKDEKYAGRRTKAVQYDLFTDIAKEEEKEKELDAQVEREKKAQEAILALRKKFGKNAVFKGMDLEEGATGRERNQQIGGHKA